jgi:hypothetical protein
MGRSTRHDTDFGPYEDTSYDPMTKGLIQGCQWHSYGRLVT